MSKRKNTRKIMISLGVVGAAAAVAGMGTFGTFTSTTSGSASVTAGTVVIDLNGGALNPLGLTVANLVAGDVIQRPVTLNNTGNSDLASIKLNTTATTSSLLDTPTGTGNSANGLQLKIDSCSGAWGVPTSTTLAVCSGTTSAVLASGPIALGTDQALNNLKALSSTTIKSDNLMVTVSLPATAGNDFQGKTSVLNFAFTATQRGATNTK